jgi:hypothetical protein
MFVYHQERELMHLRTVNTLKQLEEANWFSHVGVQDVDTAIVVSSWQEAMDYCSSSATKNLWLEAANHYSMRLVERSKERFRLWNAIALEMRPVVDTFVSRKIEAVARENNLPKDFRHLVRWEMIHLCMECEYADVYPPGFFASHAYWYTRGHFPCGWQGNFPNDGHLVLY